MTDIGILDYQGRYNNPLTSLPYSYQYKELAQIWSKFPAYKEVDKIIQALKTNQITIIISGTGSGKTVLVPKFMLHTLNYVGKVAITLPKQILTQSSADYAAKTLDVQLGEQVGYQFRGSPREMRSDKTKLLYATDGTIVQRLLKDPSLKDFDAVIIDEAHERKVQIDFLIFLLKKALEIREDLKVVIMSATINSKLFKSYFEGYKYGEINIGTETHYPIEDIYLPIPVSKKEYVSEGLKIINKIVQEDDITTSGSHDILFFIASVNEALDVCKRIGNDNRIKELSYNVYCVEVYAGMDNRNQELAQDKNKYKAYSNSKRKIVVATNVAESSLTIDGIKFVIDSGYELNGRYDPELRARRLDLERISKAQARQRKGRAGRTESGVCYHLYTKDEEDEMKDYPEPDIRTSNIVEESLRLLSLVDTEQRLLTVLSKFIEPPKETYVKSALKQLNELGAIIDGKITHLGYLMVQSYGDPMMSKTLLYSKLYKCQHELSKIFALIDVSRGDMGGIFIMPNKLVKPDMNGKIDKKRLEQMKDKFNKARSTFQDAKSDFISLLNLYEIYAEKKEKYKDNPQKLKDWCYEKFVKMAVMEKARRYRKKIIRDLAIMGNIDIPVDEDILKKNIIDRVEYCLYNGYNTQIATNKDGIYHTPYAKIDIDISKDSFVDVNYKEVLYYELFISMGRATLNFVSQIKK